ncbi:MAG TPA: hypothetical protein VK635_18845, partial [Bradyrhizobium sp.]|nr:hypothetical protein [Bradyrhizobium sp.]
AAAADAEAKAREYQRFVDDLKIAAEVLRKSARAAWVACPGCCAAHPGPRSARPEHRLRDALLIRGLSFLMGPGSAVHRRRGAAPRPGHEGFKPPRRG